VIEKEAHSLLESAVEVAGRIAAVVLLLRLAVVVVQPILWLLITIIVLVIGVAIGLWYYRSRW
jgi:hypothetical protein